MQNQNWRDVAHRSTRQLVDRLKEPSSYAGLGVILGGVGIHIDDGLLQTIIYGVASVCGVLAYFIPE